MADTIVLNLDESAAIAGLDTFIEKLGDAQKDTTALAESGKQVTVAQTQQIVILNKQADSWATFAASATESSSKVSVATIGLVGNVVEMGHELERFAIDAGRKAVNTLFDIAEMTVKYTLLTKGAVSVIGAVKGSHKEAADATAEHTAEIKKQGDSFLATAAKATVLGVAIRSLTGDVVTSGEAAKTAGTATAQWLAGLGKASVVIAGVVVAIKAGDEFSQLMGRIQKDTEKATSDMGRLENAAAGAAKNLTRPFSEVGPALSGILSQTREDFGKWAQSIGDEAYKAVGMKEATDWGVKNLKEWDTFFERWIDEARGNFVRFEASARSAFGFKTDSEDQLKNYADEAKALRDLASWHEKMDVIRAKEKDGFSALAEGNRKYIQSIKDQAREEEIGAIKTSFQIDMQIEAIRRLAAQRVQSGKISPEEDASHKKRLEAIDLELKSALDAATTKEQKAKAESQASQARSKEELDWSSKAAQLRDKEITALEQRRTQINREESQKRIEQEKAEAEAVKTALKSLYESRTSQTQATALDSAQAGGASEKQLHEMRMRWIDEEAEAKSDAAKSNAELIVIEADAEKKRIAEVEAFRRDQTRQSFEMQKQQRQWLDANSDASNEIGRARAEFADATELQSLQLKLNSQKNFAASTKKELEDERQRQLNVDKEVHDKKLELIERETERNIEAAKTKEQQLKAVSDGELKRMRENAEYEKQLASDATAYALKLAEEEQRKKDDLKKAQQEALKPTAEAIIGSQSTEERVKELQNVRAKAAADKYRNDNSQLYEQSQSDLGARRKFAAGQDKAQLGARRQALRDVDSGKTTADDQASVAKNLADKTIGQMAKGGKLDTELVKAQTEAVKVIAQQQANTDALTKQVTQIEKVLGALGKAADDTRGRAQQGNR